MGDCDFGGLKKYPLTVSTFREVLSSMDSVRKQTEAGGFKSIPLELDDLGKRGCKLSNLVCQEMTGTKTTGTETTHLPDRMKTRLDNEFLRDHAILKTRSLEEFFPQEGYPANEFFHSVTPVIAVAAVNLAADALRNLPATARRGGLGAKYRRQIYHQADEVLSDDEHALGIARHLWGRENAIFAPSSAAAMVFWASPGAYGYLRLEQQPEIEKMGQELADQLLEKYGWKMLCSCSDTDVEAIASGFCKALMVRESDKEHPRRVIGDDKVVDWMLYASECLFGAVQFWYRQRRRVDCEGPKQITSLLEKRCWRELHEAFAAKVDSMAKRGFINHGQERKKYWRPRWTKENLQRTVHMNRYRSAVDPLRCLLEMAEKGEVQLSY